MNDFVTSMTASYAGAGTTWFGATQAADRMPLFAALVSRFNHDLRTPLNTFAGWTHLLQASAADAARTRHVAEVFGRNVREQTVLLEEFVDDARALLEVLTLESSQVDAAEVLAAATQRLAPLLDVHEVQLEQRIECDGAQILVDRARATRLVYRLVADAVRRAPEGGAVRLQAGVDDPCLAVDIAGPSQRTALDNGLLLDLRIASAVAKHLRATLDIGAPEHGSRFQLRLPLKP